MSTSIHEDILTEQKKASRQKGKPIGKTESWQEKGINRKKETYFCSSGLMKWWESW
jgi:hypothetical protein